MIRGGKLHLWVESNGWCSEIAIILASFFGVWEMNPVVAATSSRRGRKCWNWIILGRFATREVRMHTLNYIFNLLNHSHFLYFRILWRWLLGGGRGKNGTNRYSLSDVPERPSYRTTCQSKWRRSTTHSLWVLPFNEQLKRESPSVLEHFLESPVSQGARRLRLGYDRPRSSKMWQERKGIFCLWWRFWRWDQWPAILYKCKCSFVKWAGWKGQALTQFNTKWSGHVFARTRTTSFRLWDQVPPATCWSFFA